MFFTKCRAGEADVASVSTHKSSVEVSVLKNHLNLLEILNTDPLQLHLCFKD